MFKNNCLYLYFGQKRRFGVKLAKKGNLSLLDARAKNTVGPNYICYMLICIKHLKGTFLGNRWF